MIFLRVPRLVMDFLPDQHEDLFVLFLVIALKSVDENIMVGDDDHIHTGFEGGCGNVFVQAAPVRVSGVHVQVDNDFVHKIPRFKFFPPPGTLGTAPSLMERMREESFLS